MHTPPVMVPAGCTPLVQPLDVCLNKPFKDRIRDQHYVDHISECSTQKCSASERRILMTQWVGQAWESIHQELRHTIQRSFRKCGITVAIDGSEDQGINIRGLDNYRVDSQAMEDLNIGIDNSDTFLFYFKESLTAFILSRIWRWTAAPGGTGRPLSSTRASPCPYLRYLGS